MNTRIVSVRAIPLERKLERVFRGSTYSITSRNTLVTEVCLSNGVIGQTFGGDEEKYQKEVVAAINGPFQELLIGEDVLGVEKAWDRMFRCNSLDLDYRGIHTLDLTNWAIQMQAIAAVDIAMWDAIGKSTGLPLYKLLGAYRDKVPVIGIGGYFVENKADGDFSDELCNYRRMGLAGMKLKVGRLSTADDADRVAFIRERMGESFVIVCDANQGWTVSQAVDFCRRVRHLNVRWIEEPVQWYDQLRGLPEVRAQGGVPVAAGQGEISRFGCRDLVAANAVDILNVDATIAGGVTEWRRIAAFASMMNVTMAHHEEPQVAAHLLASIPHGLFVEIFPDRDRDPMWQELPCTHPRVEDGFMHIPTSPGLGMPLRAELIEQYRGSCVVS